MSAKKKARISNIKEVDKKIKGEREELKENKKNRKKAKRQKLVKKFFIFNFLLGTICCYIGLFVVYGPNTMFRNWFITTAEASMRHKYYARWFYDESTIDYVMSKNDVIETNNSTDTSLYKIDEVQANSQNSKEIKYKNKYDRQIREKDPEHPDYKIIEFKDEKLKSGRSFDGYLAVIYDPSRIHTVVTQYLGTRGEYIKDMAKRVNAVVAINGGGFVDPNYNSNGANPLGITMAKGKILRSDETYNGAGGIIGFNEDNQLVLTKCSRSQVKYLGIRDCVTFEPFIIVNGEASKVLGNGGWGVAPRTVIGQRADGIVLFFVSDGRSGLKQGIDVNDEIEIMERYEAINAANLDGGTSSVMIVNGEMINDPIDSTGAHKTRWISTGFYLEPEE